MPHSSMGEQAVVNRAVVGSSPTGAAIHCRVDELVSRIALNDEVAGSSPALAIKPCGVIGNIPLKAKIPGSSPGGAAKLCSCSPTGRGCRFKNGMLWVRFSPRVAKLAPVAQLEEVADLKSVWLWVRLPPGVPTGCNSVARSHALGAWSRRFESCHPDMPLSRNVA